MRTWASLFEFYKPFVFGLFVIAAILLSGAISVKLMNQKSVAAKESLEPIKSSKADVSYKQLAIQKADQLLRGDTNNRSVATTTADMKLTTKGTTD